MWTDKNSICVFHMFSLDYNFSSNASKSASSKSRRKAIFCRLSPRRSSRFRSTLFSRSSIFFNVSLSSALGVLSFLFLFFSTNASLGEGLLSFFLSSFSFLLFFLLSALRTSLSLNFASQEESSPRLVFSFYLELNFSALTNHSRLEQPVEMVQALDLHIHEADFLEALVC